MADQTGAKKEVRMHIRNIGIIALLICSVNAYAGGGRIVVAKNGKADFRTIQGAINSLSDSSATPRVIFIKDGVYDEKLYIEKHNIVLCRESRGKTIITQAIVRDEWRCLHNDDWGVATINIDANDITLQNLTITNSFGF